MNTTEEVEFDYQAYMKEHAPDPDKLHRGPEARQKRREAAVRNNYGAAYGEKGDYDGAVDDYNKAIELNPNYTIDHYNRGVVWSYQTQVARSPYSSQSRFGYRSYRPFSVGGNSNSRLLC